MIALVKLQDSLRSTQVSDKKKKPKSSAKETHLSVNETYTCSKRGPSNKGKRGLQKGYKSEVRTCVREKEEEKRPACLLPFVLTVLAY